MLINATDPEEIRVATLVDGVLTDFDIEFIHNEKIKGNIYRAKIVRVDQSLQAAFIHYGGQKNGFLPIGELPKDLVSGDGRRGRIQDLLSRDQEIMVQAAREELGSKGAMMTGQISLPGRYLVLTPGSPTNGISRKIESREEREYFKKLVDEMEIPKNFGVIVRTASMGVTKEDFQRDLDYLMDTWKEIQTRYKNRRGPGLVWQEDDVVTRTLRDGFSADMEEVHIDDLETFETAQHFFRRTMPQHLGVLKHYIGKKPLFSKHQTDEQIDRIYARKVNLPSGGALVLDQTEALVAIDVNSGKTSGDGVEDMAFKTNMEAAEEAARQLRLRDLAGLVAIDFIDMKREGNIRHVQEKLVECLREDKARMEVGKINRFGVLIMTRQRIRPSIHHVTHENCPTCQGVGKVKNLDSMVLSVLRRIKAMVSKDSVKELRVKVAPAIAMGVLNGKRRELAELEEQTDVRVLIESDPMTAYGEMVAEIERAEEEAPEKPAAQPKHREREREEETVVLGGDSPISFEAALGEDKPKVRTQDAEIKYDRRDAQRAALEERERLRALFESAKPEDEVRAEHGGRRTACGPPFRQGPQSPQPRPWQGPRRAGSRFRGDSSEGRAGPTRTGPGTPQADSRPAGQPSGSPGASPQARRSQREPPRCCGGTRAEGTPGAQGAQGTQDEGGHGPEGPQSCGPRSTVPGETGQGTQGTQGRPCAETQGRKGCQGSRCPARGQGEEEDHQGLAEGRPHVHRLAGPHRLARHPPGRVAGGPLSPGTAQRDAPALRRRGGLPPGGDPGAGDSREHRAGRGEHGPVGTRGLPARPHHGARDHAPFPLRRGNPQGRGLLDRNPSAHRPVPSQLHGRDVPGCRHPHQQQSGHADVHGHPAAPHPRGRHDQLHLPGAGPWANGRAARGGSPRGRLDARGPRAEHDAPAGRTHAGACGGPGPLCRKFGPAARGPEGNRVEEQPQPAVRSGPLPHQPDSLAPPARRLNMGGRRMRLQRTLLAGGLASALNAQGLPTLPAPGPETRSPTSAELLPLRPFDPGKDRGESIPFRWRGEMVQEIDDLWIIEKGLLQSESVLLLADRIQYQPSTGELVAEGNIRLEAPSLRLRCGRLRMDWKRQVGEAQALELELPPSWTLRSDRVEFTTFRHWNFEAVEISPCPQDDPGWKARLSSLRLDLDAFATFRNAKVIVGPVPVLYLPWAIYPAKAQRSSGLLPPTLGYSGTLGATLGLPYYQVLGPTADLTFQPQEFSRQGLMLGGEARWNPEPTHQGSLFGEWIRQRNPEARRYRAGFREVWQREDGWQVAADLNRASDNLLENDYGRGVGSPSPNPFDSAVYLGRSFTWASLALSGGEQRTFSYPDDPFYGSAVPSSLKRRTLPQLDLRVFPLQVGSLYLDADLRANRFAYRVQVGEDRPEQGYSWNRLDFSTRLHGRLGQWGPFRTDFQLGGRVTHYGGTLTAPVFQVGALPPDAPTEEVLLEPFKVKGPATVRYLGSARLQFSGPQMGRRFEGLNLFGWSGDLKHVFEPFWALTRATRFGQDARLPRFDDLDSRPGVGGSAVGEESFEVGLKQHLMGRPGAGEAFADLVRYRLSARYHATPILLPDGRTRKGWSSLNSEVDVEPSDTLRLSFRRSSDLGAGGSDTSLSTEIRGKQGGLFSLAAFSSGLDQFLVRQRGVQVGGLQRMWDDRLRLEFQGAYDLDRRGFSNAQVAGTYVTPCVAWVLRFSHVAISQVGAAGKEDRVDLTLTLRGLGDLFTYRR